MSPSVHIIVLNWNGKEVIEDCLSSINKIKYDNYKVLIVDNNSTDDSVEIINQKFPQFDILRFDTNYGFADGNNRGIKYLKDDNPDYVIFLNNDTEVEPNFIEPLIQPLEENQSIGQTVPKIFYANDKNKIWYAGGKVNLWTGRICHVGIREVDSIKYKKSVETDYATGCCFAMRYNDFVEFGGFDSSFKMYSEDVDLSLRIRELGQIPQFIPNSIIWHKISSSVGGEFAFKKAYKKFKGYLKLFLKHTNTLQKLTIPICWLISIPILFIKILKFKLIIND